MSTLVTIIYQCSKGPFSVKRKNKLERIWKVSYYLKLICSIRASTGKTAMCHERRK